MTRLPPALRKAGLTAHIVCSLGWLGAVLVFLTLGIAAAHGDDVELVRSAYRVMDWTGSTVLVPLAIGSVLTGVVQALITPWGLFRHYWVIIKLVLALIATVILVAYTETLARFAEVADREPPLTADELQFLHSSSVLLHTGGGLVLLITATVLAVYKPQGLTRYGQRRRRAAERRHSVSA